MTDPDDDEVFVWDMDEWDDEPGDPEIEAARADPRQMDLLA